MRHFRHLHAQICLGMLIFALTACGGRNLGEEMLSRDSGGDTSSDTDSVTDTVTDSEVGTDTPTEFGTDTPTELGTDTPSEMETDTPTEFETDTPTFDDECEQPSDCPFFGMDCWDVECVWGSCVINQKNAGDSCDDDSLCTQNDTCNAFGFCRGDLVDCTAFGDECNFGACNPVDGSCYSIPTRDGGSCDDGDICTGNGICSSGSCLTGTAKDCTALDGECVVGQCDPANGNCTAQPVGDLNFCDDGDLCTVFDICLAGTCKGLTTDCSGLDDECNVGYCDPADGSCVKQPAGDGSSCDDGDVCSSGDVCTAGFCGGTPVDCSGIDDDCNVGECNIFDGSCFPVPSNDGGVCDDGDFCSTGDVCTFGNCGGAPVDCSGLDDTCNTGTCDPADGSCIPSPINDGGICDDADICTTGEVCASGTCGGSPVDCSGLDDTCNAGTCDPIDGSCIATPVNDGGMCDDGDICTNSDMCTGGTCAGGPADCSELDDTCNVGACSPVDGSCVPNPINEGGSCDDGSLCTTVDVCTAGTCGGAPADCTAFDDDCNAGTCNPIDGNCISNAVNEGGSCDDGDLCSTGDTCASGSCEGAIVDCSGLDDTCNAGSCDPADGSCIATPINDGGGCDDGDFCSAGDVCTAGICGGGPVDCSGLDDTCNAGSCDPADGSCIATPINDGGGCDDGDFCSAGDVCTAGTCGGGPVDCSGLDDTCNAGSCDPADGSCMATPINDGGGCDDGDFCSAGDVCTAGTCGGGPVDCSGLDDTCNAGSCDPADGSCIATPINDGGGCDDGDFCSAGDVCTAGTCGGGPVDCSGLDDTCNAGSCDPADGSCIATPINDGGGCDDGDFCSAGDVCTAGTCGGGPVDCSGLDDTCNAGSCDPADGSCIATPINDGGGCDDGDFCSAGDVCTAGTCGGGPVDCSGLDDTCNAGSCDPADGSCMATPINDGGGCDDGDFCSAGDVCTAGTCGGGPVDCSGLDDTCNAGSCDPADGSCIATPINDGGGCDDGDFCSTGDVCTAGTCGGGPVDCSGLDDTCNAGSCDPADGSCIATPINDGGGCDDSDFCTAGDVCTAGTCGGGPVDCSGLDDTCNAGSCDPADGSCIATPINDGGGCDDSDFCTAGDVCTAGTCGGGPVDCSGLDDTCNAGSCDPADGSCIATPINDGGGCDDGDFCSTGDVCTAGTCGGGPVDCSGLDDTCNAGSCDPADGSCIATPINDGGGCDDGDFCSTGDVCTAGTCGGGPVDCSGLDDTCNAGSCDPADGSCIATPINDGGGCDDGDFCSTGDVCTAGTCGGGPVDCSGLDDTCNAGSCDPADGSCIATPINDGGGCDDGDFCSTGDVCTAGTCGGGPVDCSGLDDTCNAGSCDPADGSCIATPINDGGGCDDSDFCTAGDVCTAGTCGGGPVDCSGLDDTCNAGSCDPADGSCIATPINDGGGCDDSDFCTAGDVCTAGTCGGGPVDCSGLDDTCNAGSCDPADGSCIATPINDGGGCDDSDFCTAGDVCTAGTCGGGPVDCSGLDDTCNAGSCDPADGSCIATPINDGGGCDDSDFCTAGDVCTAGTCGGGPVDCSGLDDTCNAGSCDPADGSCIATPINDGGGCDDSDFCTAGDVCTAGTCGGGPVDCSGLDDTCNAGSCDPADGSCIATPINDGGGCDDSDFCTAGDVCTAGTCGGGPVDCSGLDDTCNAGSCDPADGSCIATPINDGGGCDDSDFCTAGDVCTAGTCGGGPVDCSGLDDTCNAGSCDPADGSCIATPINDGGGCDDGDFCSTGDVCTAGTCGGGPVDCSGLDDTCNAGSCDPADGSCIATPINDGGGCDDSDFCTAGDVCTAGTCGGGPVDCSGLDDTCNAGSCDPADGSCIASPVNEGGGCDDSDLCTNTDICTAGTCAGWATDCSGLDDTCNFGTCDPADGSCFADPINEGGICDDGDLCTTADTCTAGTCGGGPVDCSGLDDACNAGSCNPADGSCFADPVNDGGVCDDGDLCTETDQCSVGTCSGAPLDCSAFDNDCSQGLCNGGTGTCFADPINEGSGCDDFDLCTNGDTCTLGVCDGSATDCTGLDDQCNLGSCNGGTGFCEATPANEGLGCDDGIFCTSTDVCSSGTCTGAIMDCTHLDGGCIVGICDDLKGKCVAIPGSEGSSCDDGDLCTASDSCTAGTCSGTTKDCSYLNSDCSSGSCEAGTGNCVSANINEGLSCDDGDLCTSSETCSSGVCSGTITDCSAWDDQCNLGACNSSTGLCGQSPANEGSSCDDGNACTASEVCVSGTCEDATDGYVFYEDFNNNHAGWSLETDWDIGSTTGASCLVGTDPSTDHTAGTTDNGVAGVNLGGCTLSTIHPSYCITSPTVNTAGLSSAWLTYWRWLGSDDPGFMGHTVELWDGGGWVTLFDAGATISDTSWQYQSHDINAYKSAATQVRWCFDVTSASAWESSGWNIDDVTIGESACTPPASSTCGDGVVNGDDLCDGTDLDGQTCVGRGYDSGTLGCTPGCDFDESGCLSSIFFDDFEGPFPGSWTLIDVDRSTPNAAVAQFTTAWIADADVDDPAETVAQSTSWYDPAGASDDWMISEAIAIGPTSTLLWDARSAHPFYPEIYEVRVSTTTPDRVGCLANPALFTTAGESNSWTGHTVDLAAAGYSNQTIYIAFRNISNDNYILEIDNVAVED